MKTAIASGLVIVSSILVNYYISPHSMLKTKMPRSQ